MHYQNGQGECRSPGGPDGRGAVSAGAVPGWGWKKGEKGKVPPEETRAAERETAGVTQPPAPRGTVRFNFVGFAEDSRDLLLCRRQWHPTPVLLPGKSHGWRSLVGCGPWGC